MKEFKTIRINDEVIYINNFIYTYANNEIILEIDEKNLNFFKQNYLYVPRSNQLKKDYCFDIESSNFLLKNCLIKTLEFYEELNNKIEITIIFDYFSKLNKREIRHNKIKKILNKRIN